MKKFITIFAVFMGLAMVLGPKAEANGNQGSSLQRAQITAGADTTSNLGRVVLKAGNNMSTYWVPGTGTNPDTIYFASSISAGDIDSADVGNGTLAWADLAKYLQNKLLLETELDSKSEFDTQIADGTNVWTSSDLDALNNVSALTEVAGNLLYTDYDGSGNVVWKIVAPSATDEYVLTFESDDSTMVWQADDDTPGAGSLDSSHVNDGTLAWADLATYLQNKIIIETELDAETELETQLADVTNVFTNNDGALADDNLGDDDLDALQNVQALTETPGNMLIYDSGGWTVVTPSANDEYVLTFESDDSTFQWQADDDVPESGDFGAAGALEADGSLSAGVVDSGNVTDGDLCWNDLNMFDKKETFWPVYSPSLAVRGLTSSSNPNDVLCKAPFDTLISNAMIRGAMCWTDEPGLDSILVSALWELPWDFKNWATTGCVKAYYKTGNASADSNAVKFYVYKSDSTAYDKTWDQAANTSLSSVTANASDFGTWDADDAAELVCMVNVKTNYANYALPSKWEFKYQR